MRHEHARQARTVTSWIARAADVGAVVILILAAIYIFNLRQRVADMEQSLRDRREVFDVAVGDDLRGLLGNDATGVARPRLVVYMTPSCGSCEQNVPQWRELALRVGGDNLIVLAPKVADAVGEVGAYLRSNKLPYEKVVYLTARDIDRYNLHAVPRTFITDREGVVKYAWRGPVDSASVLHAWAAVGDVSHIKLEGAR